MMLLIFSNELVPWSHAVRYAFPGVPRWQVTCTTKLDCLPPTIPHGMIGPVVYNSVAIKSVYDPAKQGFLITIEGDSKDKIVYSPGWQRSRIIFDSLSGPDPRKTKKTNITAKAITIMSYQKA